MKNHLQLNSEARELRNLLGITDDSPIDLFALVQTLENVTMIMHPMSSMLSGICLKKSDQSFIVINSLLSYGRQRFTLAHELYHLFFQQNKVTTVCLTDLSGKKSEEEKEADIFASYVMIPYDALQMYAKKNFADEKININQIVQLEQKYGMSRRALLWRLVNQGLLAKSDINEFSSGVIVSALRLGYDDSLYRPSDLSKQYYTYGELVRKVIKLNELDLLSQSKFDEILLDAFRHDLVFGEIEEETEIYD